MSENNNGKFLLGAAIGALAGAAVGILFAPRSGKETRKILGDKTKEYSEKGKELLAKGQQIAKEKIHEAAKVVEEKTK